MVAKLVCVLQHKQYPIQYLHGLLKLQVLLYYYQKIGPKL